MEWTTKDDYDAVVVGAGPNGLTAAVVLATEGLEWIDAPVALAHPFDDGTAATLRRSLDDTARSLGPDADAWRRLMRPFLDRAKGRRPARTPPSRAGHR